MKDSTAANGTAVIGGRTYRTVTIGGMTWMAENLRADVEGSFASDSEYEDRYGRLYTWDAALEAAAEAQGWHLPSESEWDALATAVGGANTAGTKLKSTTGWSEGNGTDDYGFSALPAGYYYSGSFNTVGSYGNFWTSTEYDISSAYYRSFSSGASMSSDFYTKNGGHSVRLVKDIHSDPAAKAETGHADAAEVRLSGGETFRLDGYDPAAKANALRVSVRLGEERAELVRRLADIDRDAEALGKVVAYMDERESLEAAAARCRGMWVDIGDGSYVKASGVRIVRDGDAEVLELCGTELSVASDGRSVSISVSPVTAKRIGGEPAVYLGMRELLDSTFRSLLAAAGEEGE